MTLFIKYTLGTLAIQKRSLTPSQSNTFGTKVFILTLTDGVVSMRERVYPLLTVMITSTQMEASR